MVVANVAHSASEQLRQLPRCLESRDGFREALAALQAARPASFDGAWGSSCALLAATLAGQLAAPLVVVCPQADQMDDLADDLSVFRAAPALEFPVVEDVQVERLIHDDVFGQRLKILKRLGQAAAQPSVIITSIEALLQPVPQQTSLQQGTRQLRIGERVDIEGLRRWLVENRFHPTTAVELPGEFSYRGGILDLFTPDAEQPVRVEFFDDEVESIRHFDVATQRSLDALTATDITVPHVAAGNLDHLASYLPARSVFLMIDPDQIVDHGQRYLSRLEKPEAYHSVQAVLQSFSPFGVASVTSIAVSPESVHCHLGVESVERFSGDFAKVREELDRVGAEDVIYLLSQTEAEIRRLSDIFATTSVSSSGRLHFAQGHLRSGFRLRADHVVVITGAEIFHRGELRRTAKRHLGKAIDSFLDLEEGDLVVHLSHGIGRYRGLKLLEKNDYALEHLEIEFDGGTKLYVPAAKIDLIQKYVGGTKSRPKLAKIGGQSWIRQKAAAQSAVMDMAAELLEMQATRSTRLGIAFTLDSDWQQAFDASFPYHETPDQTTAIDVIKQDMERSRPMDRLLCGDVGFGKTEVAMRAAFKAVDNGYQVAILVPTTILAEQHYQTFRQRMAEFPFDIARLSRFCSPPEERAIIAGLQKGKIDVVIGTHRLASQDVQFYNLGLVIIDEEQRFGVEVKERLKTLRTTVDVLTMTATPIPRTLHMSLVGVRDISNLETAPEDRMAIETRVVRFQNELVRHAVLRELNRNGQIYFVHNRVNDIDVVEKKLRAIVPEARIRIAHGQMREDELEEVMVDFVAHRFDLLLATTIVESGLDIPNANTIFIDEADRYGLADLHQLRGRVGRYKHRAYCYLLVDPRKHITPSAARRLHAIEEFSDMGAGFAIAMRDLEIRGAGNLLGSQQSGHIAAVGYELYCQLLENAVRTLKKMPPRPTLDVDIDLPGRNYLPDSYIPDLRAKIDVYRRLARIADDPQLQQIRDELRDRFGDPPAPVQRMLELTELKIDAAVWQIAAIRLEDGYVVFSYAKRPRIEHLARFHPGKLRIVDSESAYFPLPPGLTDADQILSTVKSVLRPGSKRS